MGLADLDVMASWAAAAAAVAAAGLLGFLAGQRRAAFRARQARAALEQRARRHERLAEHSRDAILVVRTADGRILDANAGATALYGYTREELCGLSVYDLRHGACAAQAPRQLAEAAAGAVRFDAVHRRKDGSTFPVEVNSQSAALEEVRAVVSVVRDVTARKAAEEALRQSEERLALAVEAAGLGMFHAEPYGRMVWSPRSREIFGIGAAEIPDFEAFLALVHPDDRERVRADAARWTDPTGDGAYEGEYRCVRPDGSTRFIAAAGRARFAMVDGVRRPLQLVGTLLDVTDQRTAQAALMQADRLASVGLLAAGVAHEVNNPLAYVIAALDVLDARLGACGGAPDPDALEALGEAREGAERVRDVMRDLRTFAGAREERLARVSLERVVESALHLAANELRYRARVTRDYRPAPPVLADQTRLGQVALNLLVNAAHACASARDGGHEVRVVVGTDVEGRALLEVHDTGGGIPPAIADRIFDPFFTTKREGEGTGLGLSICRSIVVGLGGEIAATQRPGGGTTMRVLLPPAPPEAAAPETGAAASPPPAPDAGAPLRRGRVLVVDDEPAVATAVRRLLASEHEVTIRNRAEDALAAVSEGERFDAILCDLMMPGMTGMELHAALERLAPDQARRVIVLTGGAFTDGARAFLDRVALPRCEKPFDVRALRATVRAVVGAPP